MTVPSARQNRHLKEGVRQITQFNILAVPKSDKPAHLVSGVVWTGGLRWAAQLISWSSSIFVLRILAPEDYGLVAMSTAITTWLTTISSFGILESIAYGSLPEERERAQLFTISLFIGFLAGALLFIGAPLLGRAYGEQRVIGIVRLQALTVFLTSASAVPSATLSRKLEFRRAALIDFVRSLLQVVSVLFGAIAGFGYWSLAIGPLVGALGSAGLALALQPIVPAAPSISALRDRLSNARWFVTGAAAWQGMAGGEAVIGGARLGASSLGLYNVAKTLTFVPVEKLVSVITAVTPAVFASIVNDRDRTREYYLRTLDFTLTLVAIPCVGLATVADLMPGTILNERWRGVESAMVLLVPYAILYTISSITGQVSAVTAGPRRNVLSALLGLPLLLISFVVLSRRFDISGLAVSWAIVLPIIIYIPLRGVMASVGVRWVDLWRAAAPATVGALSVMVAVLMTRLVLLEGRSEWGKLLCSALVGGLSASTVMLRTESELGRRMRKILGPKFIRVASADTQ